MGRGIGGYALVICHDHRIRISTINRSQLRYNAGVRLTAYIGIHLFHCETCFGSVFDMSNTNAAQQQKVGCNDSTYLGRQGSWGR